MPDSSPQLVPAVDRAFRMLVTLQGGDGGRRISDLARELGIPKSSAHQIATTLVHHGVLERDQETRRYRLGAGLVDIAAHRRARIDLPLLAGPYLEDLAISARMTALLGLRDDDKIVLAAKIDSPDPIDVSAPLGHRLDARAGVFGKLFDAALGIADLEDRLGEPLPAFARKTITHAKRYAQDLHSVRERGYALDVEEYLDGVAAVGAAVRDRDGEVLGALCVIGLAASYDHSELADIGEAVRASAESLSYDLGFKHSRPTDQTVMLPRRGRRS